MIPPLAEEFLRTHTRAFLVTVRPDGAPACHPMVVLWRDGGLYVNTYRKSAKARNLAADPRVACVVVTDDDAPDFRGVVVRGRAEPVDAGERVGAADTAGDPVPVGEDVTRLVRARLAEGKRVVLRIVPEEVQLVGRHA